jgi:hypothetical protein
MHRKERGEVEGEATGVAFTLDPPHFCPIATAIAPHQYTGVKTEMR